MKYYSLYSSSQILLLKDWVVIPNDPAIQLNILQNCNDSALSGHTGLEKTFKPVTPDFNWSGMTQFSSIMYHPVNSVQKQKYPAQEVWKPQTSSKSKWSLDSSLDEFYHQTVTF
ncbi:hypothetical protein O181_043865 [Austropuccinia psidii MF-1]|uniref:Integrase zinc-binding domain-containing protein n=1 Tax=Austropuccinia psidii MF-1 TaxID=1389203 RepID=A0A9Q3DJ36_9BASI|nr:hypothetical protein [Austropuccinia psidii MF-1]